MEKLLKERVLFGRGLEGNEDECAEMGVWVGGGFEHVGEFLMVDEFVLELSCGVCGQE